MRVVHRYQSEHVSIELSVSDDALKMFAKVIPGVKCGEIPADAIREQVLKIADESRIDSDVINDIQNQLHQGRGCEARRVAKGEAPVQGRDGKVVWLVRRFQKGIGVDSNRELADFYNLGLFENIEIGREVARIYKPTLGTNGSDVFGKIIATKPGKGATLRYDKTIEFKDEPARDDYQTLVAAVNGYAHEESGKITIRDTLAIEGNLDYEMGHIDFIGNVRVSGDVQKGFHIKARGDIEILGSVLGENQLTSDGSISIKGFHQGGDGSSVRARKNYTVGIAQNVNAECGGVITINKEARDCSFRTSACVLAERASVIGGTIWCVSGFEGRVLGNASGVRTIIEIRNELEVTPEYRRVEESIKKHEVALAALELHIGPYLQNRKRVPLLATKFRVKISELLNRYDGVQASLTKLQDSMKRMREAKPMKDDSRISVSSLAHAGVSLGTTLSKLDLQEDKKGPVSFKPPSGEGVWTISNFEPLART